MIVDHPLARLAALPGTAPAHALPVYLPQEVEILVKSVAVPVHGLGGLVTGLASRAFAPRTVRGHMDKDALAVTRLAPPLSVCGLNAPGRGLLTPTVTAECARDCLAVARPGVTNRGHMGPATSHVTVAGLMTALPFLLTARGQERGVGGLDGVTGIARRLLLLPAFAATLGQRWSPSSFPDLVKLFLSLSGPVAQRDVAIGSMLLAAGVTGAGVLPGPAATVTSVAPVVCSSAMPAPSVSTPAGAASATASPGRCERARESSRPERRHRRSSCRERSRLGGKHGKGRSPSPARSARSASVSASFSESSDTEERVSAMPPSPSRRSGVGGGRSKSDHSVSGRDRSPRPGPSGLGSGERSAPHTDRSRSEYCGRSSPTPSGAAEDDRDSISSLVDLDRDDSFRTVLRLIWEFHSLEEPASVAPNRCKTSLAPIYGLQSESSPAFHFPLSPLLQSLLEDTNLAPVHVRGRPNHPRVFPCSRLSPSEVL